MVMGRPREWDRDEIARKLLEWAQKDDSDNLCGFCAENMLPPSYITVWAKECDNFSKAYDLAKNFVGLRRERKLSKGELHVKAYDLNAQVYDYFLKQEKRAEAEYEAKLKAKENQMVSDEVVQKFDDLMSALSSDQRASNSNITDNKS